MTIQNESSEIRGPGGFSAVHILKAISGRVLTAILATAFGLLSGWTVASRRGFVFAAIGGGWLKISALNRQVFTLIGWTWWILAPLGLWLAVLVLFSLHYRLRPATKESIHHQLNLIEQLAPMVGLLGTVWALAEAAGSLKPSGDVQALVSALAPKIGNALYSTIAGLLIAIPAFLCSRLTRNNPSIGARGVSAAILLATLLISPGSAHAQGLAEISSLPLSIDQIWQGTVRPDRTEMRKASMVDLVHRAAQREGVHPLFAEAIARVESGLDPRAVSPKGCIGLFQLHPQTAREMGVADPFDPAENARSGLRYLIWLARRFGGDMPLVLIGYNAGPTMAQRWQDSAGRLPRETREYVRRVLALFQTLKNQQERT